jgi:hypothetical protein
VAQGCVPGNQMVRGYFLKTVQQRLIIIHIFYLLSFLNHVFAAFY